MRKLFPLLLILLTSCATSLQLYDIDFPEYTDIENSTIWVDASEDPLGLSAIVAEDLGYYGFNAYSENYEDMMAAGVIDPTKVTRSALQNAASVAGLMITTEAVITEIKEKAAPVAPDMGGMGGMGGMGMM